MPIVDRQTPKCLQKQREWAPTRSSLLERLRVWNDHETWRLLFETYWKLIYGVALKGGLTAAEAQDVVQETMISVAKHMPTFEYDPAIGSFKTWLLNMTRWRITDQLRKRGINMFGVHAQFPRGGYDTENGILLMQHRFQTGRLKICDNLTEWWGEYGAYGRDEKGEINKIRDDLLSATRILVMMLPRYGRTFRLGVAPPTGWRGPAGGSQSKRWTPEPEGGYFGLDP